MTTYIEQINKACTECETVKAIAKFHRNKRNKDGYMCICIECRFEYMSKYWDNNRQRSRDNAKIYETKRCREDEDYKKKRQGDFKARALVWKQNNKDKIRVHKRVAKAIKSGRLVRLPCVVCDDPKSNGHHEDYSKPFDVIWLCRSHHVQLHCGTLIL